MRIPFIDKEYTHGPHRVSFKHAINGVKQAFKSQPNFRFHSVTFVVVMSMGIFFKISSGEFLVILVLSGLIFSLEMFNTSLEALGDEVANGEYKDFIKISKDASAGGVLLAAIVSIIAGIII